MQNHRQTTPAPPSGARIAPLRVVLLCGLLSLVGAGCQPTEKLEVAVDGSSTVYLISEAVCEDFGAANPEVEVTVGASGTGGGMKKFAAGELDICDASRAMKPTEAEACKQAGIEFVRLSVAYDGIAVVVNPKNDWCDTLTVEQLKQLWRPDDPAKKWSDLDSGWPEEEIKLYGPGTDSGTFEYFTEEVVGEVGASRSDYSPNEDDNMLVTGVAGDQYALGYFGFAYYAENQDRLKLLGIDSGAGPVKPSLATVMSGEYAPLSRPLFIYVKKASLSRPEVAKFVRFYAENAAKLSEEVGYVPAPEATHAENLASLDAALAGERQPTP